MKYKNSIQAFTLIETIVSIGVIMAAIIGPLSVAVNSSTQAQDTKYQMISTYLAQEAVELLKFYRDSLFIPCTNQTSACAAIDIGGGNYEQNNESAWRRFKAGLTGSITSGTGSCFSVDGCVIDVGGFQDPALGVITWLPSTCPLLYVDETKLKGGSSAQTDGMYGCLDSTFPPSALSRVKKTAFKRIVTLTSIPATSASTYDINYNDDLRVSVTVSYTRPNGFIKSVTVVDFIRSRP